MGPDPSWDQLLCQKQESQRPPAADPSLPMATKKGGRCTEGRIKGLSTETLTYNKIRARASVKCGLEKNLC